MHHQWKLFCGMIVIICLTADRVYSGVTISTWPEGPVYPAATWLRVACRHDHAEQHRLQYRWTGGCNSTGGTTLSVPDPLYDQFGWAVIWVQSTPTECLDTFKCSVYLRNDSSNGGDLDEIASEDFFLQNVVGVGMSLPGNVFLGSLRNNSVVITNTQELSRTQEVICHSALKSSCQGQWLGAPDSVPSDCVENESEKITFNSAKLDLAVVNTEGLIVCAIEDEKGEVQRLFLGVYTAVPELTVQPSFSLSSESLFLSCTSQGAPTTSILWTRETLLLEAGVDADVSESSSLEGREAQYTSSLTLDAGETGFYSCDAYTEWTLPNRAASGRKSASAYFVVAPVSEIVQIVCTFSGQAGVEHVQWTNASQQLSGTHLVTVENTTAVMSLTVDETEHGRTYTCRGSLEGGRKYVYKHYIIIAKVPADYLTVEVQRSAPGRPFSLRCRATTQYNHTQEGSQTMLQWYKGGVPLDVEQHMSGGDNELCISLDIRVLMKHNAGEYVCRGRLLSATKTELFVSEESIVVAEDEISSSSEMSSRTAPVPAGSTEDNDNQDEDDSDDQSKSLESSPPRSGEHTSNHMLITVFIGAIGAALLLCIILLSVIIIVIAVIHSRRKQLASTSESSSNFEEKQGDTDSKLDN